MNIEEASSSKYIKTNNVIVGFIAVASKIPYGYAAKDHPGVFHLELINPDNPNKAYLEQNDLKRVLLAISQAKTNAKYVVLYHYGEQIEECRQLFARQCIDIYVTWHAIFNGH